MEQFCVLKEVDTVRNVLTRLKQMLVARLPGPVLARLRAVRRRARHLRYELRRRRGDEKPVTGKDIAASLRAAGLGAGDGVFVHSSLSRVGHVEGGPDTVLAAFEDVLGDDGVIAMPAFPLDGSTLEYLESDPVFDVRQTPSRMGSLTERFRRSPGVVRSDHPTHSVAARGPGAGELVAGHADAPTPFGDGTPFARMIDRGMYQVWFGVGLPIFTLYHAFECRRRDGFPIDVFLDEPVAARLVDADGNERTVRTLVHDPEVGRRKNRRREELRRRLAASGVLRVVELGRGEILVARMPELMDELERLLREGLTIYDIDVEPVRSAS